MSSFLHGLTCARKAITGATLGKKEGRPVWMHGISGLPSNHLRVGVGSGVKSLQILRMNTTARLVASVGCFESRADAS